MEQNNKKVNIYSSIALILSFVVIPLSFFSFADGTDTLGFVSLLGSLGIIILGIIALNKIRKSGSGGRGYAITAITISAFLFVFLTIFDIVEMTEEQAEVNAKKNSEQLAQLDHLKAKLNELENREPTTITKTVRETVKETVRNEPDLSEIIAEWTPKVGFIVCKWETSNTIASGSFTLNHMVQGYVALTNRHVLIDDLGSAPSVCILSVNGKEYTIPWAPNTYLVNDDNFVDSAFVKTNIPAQVINACNEYRFSKPKIGDKIVILGYPSIGSLESITATEGIISGIESDYYVTSAKIDEGNSGGAAVLVKNICYLGIPTYAQIGGAETLGRILKTDFSILPR